MLELLVQGTPLLNAAEEGHVATAKILIQYGADMDITTISKSTMSSLHTAAQHGHHEMVKLLVESGADVNQEADDGWTPLHQAVYVRQKKVVETLIHLGAKVCPFLFSTFHFLL
jgi:ankyrin repeat protein